MSSITANYGYAHLARTWDHGLVLPHIERAIKSIPASGRVLDLGCGNGALLDDIRKLGSWELCGIEASESGVAIAASRGFDVRQAADKAPFEARSFDLIFSVEVIEHVVDPIEFLKQARSMLKSGGRILLTTPYHGYLKNLTIAAMDRCDIHYNPLWHGGHIKFWSRNTLCKALHDTGFGRITFAGAGRVPYLWKSMIMEAVAM